MPLPPGFQLDSEPATPILSAPPAAQTPAQAAKDTADARKAAASATIEETKASEESKTAQKQAQQMASTAEGADQLISSIERAKQYVNNWSTGILGHGMQHLDASDASKLQAIINQEIRGNIFLSRVAQLKAESDSPTGGTGIGRIMQAEIPLITGAMGTLDPIKLGKDETLNSLNNIEMRTLRTKAILNNENPDDPAVQKKYGIDKIVAQMPGPASSGGGNGGGNGGNEPPGTSNLSGDQKKAYDAFLAANPNPTGDQVGAFLTKLTGQQVTNGEDIAKAIKEGRGVNTTVNNTTEQQKVADTIAHDNAAGIDQQPDALRLAIHGGTLGLSDEAAGIGNAAANVIASPFTGKFDPVGAYRLGRDVEEQRINNAQQNLGYASIPIEFAGGLASGNPEGAIASVAEAPTIAQIVRQGAKSGGAYGVISGYGSGRGAQNSLVGAGVGGVTGAALGAVGGRVLAGRTPPEVPPGAPNVSDVAGALQAEGIPAARPVADPSVRGKMAYLETTRGGHGPVQESLAQTRQAIADKVAGLTGEGSASSPGTMGETIQAAGTRTLSEAKQAAKDVYTQADKVANGAPVNPTDALAKIDGYISQLSRNPETNNGVISYLEGVRKDLAAPGGKTVGDIRDIITGAEDKINYSGLQKTRAEAIMSDVNKSLNGDASRDLGKLNPRALDLYNKADGMWRDMSNLRQQVVSRLVGPANNPLSGEQTMARVTQMMSNKGDLSRFNRTINMMSPEEQANFRASLWENIGQRSPEEGFTPGQFLAQTKNMQAGALKTVFGEDGAKSVQNLRVASRGLMDTQNALNNSRSGLVANFKDALGSILTLKHTGATGVGYAVGGVPGAIVGAAGGEVAQRAFNGLSARALMDTDVSSWIRKAATVKTTQQAQAMMGKLNSLASSNSVIQPEISGLRDMLSRALNDNAPRAGAAAASPDQRPNQQQ